MWNVGMLLAKEFPHPVPSETVNTDFVLQRVLIGELLRNSWYLKPFSANPTTRNIIPFESPFAVIHKNFGGFKPKGGGREKLFTAF